ncbi:MAG TPA: PRC-barrel domain-containing protein, partial [Afifellaceae bacterium]|nr:PRC-barrel domain-containing protein [Afifellaceae bacterium]
AVVGVGGFLGIGERNVAVEFERLQFTQDQNGETRIVADMTREELEQAQAFEDNDQTQLYGELSDEQRSTARMPEREAEGERQEMAAGEAQERQAARVPGVEPQASGLSADDLMGANVVGADNEEIGQVGDVLFSQDGQVRAVIVDVGGFLGIGAKEVAIEFDSAQVQRQDGELALMISATQEQLEQAPEWQETAELQQQDGAQQPQGQQPPAAQPPANQPPADQQQPAR